jgi:hypothetical protein
VAGGIGEEEEATTVWKPRVMEGEGKQEAGEGVEERTQIDDGEEVVEQASAWTLVLGIGFKPKQSPLLTGITLCKVWEEKKWWSKIHARMPVEWWSEGADKEEGVNCERKKRPD